MVIDADASTYIMNVEPERVAGTPWERILMSRAPSLANVLRPHGDYAIIGPGGGIDVLSALYAGSPSVTGIEINPIIANTIMRGRYATYSKHLYQRPDVHLHVTDGRSYLRSTEQQFDVVQMTLVDTWASTAAGAFALSENNLYTVEAFREYFEHLRPDGMIAVTRWEFRQPREALRVVAVAMQALHSLGVSDTARNFIVASEGPLNEDGIPVVVLAKKTAFTTEEESAVKAHFERYPRLNALYLPSDAGIGIGRNAFGDLIASGDPYGFAKGYTYNVAPVSDNSPFFFFTLKPAQIIARHATTAGIDWKVNVGVRVLLVVLVISVVAVLGFLILPLALKGRSTVAAPTALFRRRRSWLHPGRDRLHPALRIVSGPPHLRVDRGDLSADAFQRCRQPVFAALAAPHSAGMDADHPGDPRPFGRCVLLAPLVGSVGGIRILLPACDQCCFVSSTWLCDGDAIPYRFAGACGGPGDRSLWPSEWRGQCRGVGLGDECRRQCAGFGTRHNDRDPVWLKHDLGLWSGRLSARPVVAARTASPARLGLTSCFAIMLARGGGSSRAQPEWRFEETICRARSSSNGRNCELA